MKRRVKVSRRGSRRLFSATAAKVNRRNLPSVQRGGIRF